MTQPTATLTLSLARSGGVALGLSLSTGPSMVPGVGSSAGTSTAAGGGASRWAAAGLAGGTSTAAGGGASTGPAGLAAAILARSPIQYLKLDETSGTTTADSSGNGRDGTIGGTGVTLGANVGAYVLPTFATGITGHVNVYSAGLSGAFNGDEGAAVLLVRPANITAGTRHLLYLTSPLGMLIRVTQVGATLIVRREDTGGAAQTLQTGALAAGVLTFIGVKWSVANNSLSGVVGAAAIGAGASGLVTWADTLSAALISGVLTTGTTARIAGNVGQIALFSTPNVDFAAIYAASGL